MTTETDALLAEAARWPAPPSGLGHADKLIPLLAAALRAERARHAQLDAMLAETHHVIQFTDNGWTITHPLTERLDGSLFDCDAFWDRDDPEVRGRFELLFDDDGPYLGAAAS